MKKKAFLGIMLLIAAMIFSTGGTCFAQPATVELNDSRPTANLTNQLGLSYSLMPESLGGGVSAYTITGELTDAEVRTAAGGGVTVFAICPNQTDATGAFMLAQEMTDMVLDDLWDPQYSSVTPVGFPQLLYNYDATTPTGTTSTFVYYVLSPYPVANSAANGGATLYKLDATAGGRSQQCGIPFV
jgi:hypothetical protein